jgi:hypothetical protein
MEIKGKWKKREYVNATLELIDIDLKHLKAHGYPDSCSAVTVVKMIRGDWVALSTEDDRVIIDRAKSNEANLSHKLYAGVKFHSLLLNMVLKMTKAGLPMYHIITDPTMTYQAFVGVCAICKKPAKHRCGGCSVVYYCCDSHQKTHWYRHKDMCRSLQHQRDTHVFKS